MKPAVHLRHAQLHAARSLAAVFSFKHARALLVGALTVIIGACAASGAHPSSVDGGASDLPLYYLDAAVDAAAPLLDAGAVDAAPPVCVTTPCDPRLAQACGPELMNGCRLGATGPLCHGAVGTVSAGGDCATAGDCAAGLDCFAVRGGHGACGLPCCPGDDAACGAGGRCARAPMLVDATTAASWGRCVLPRWCDVLLRDTVCDPGEGCYIVSSRGDTDCRAAGTLEVGSACDGESACLPGLFCAGLMARSCVRICALGDGGAGICPSSEGSCRAYPYSPVGTGICS